LGEGRLLGRLALDDGDLTPEQSVLTVVVQKQEDGLHGGQDAVEGPTHGEPLIGPTPATI